MKKAVVYIVWFVAGQIVQIVLAELAKVSYMSRPILFSIAAGFLLTVAIIVGTRITSQPVEEKKTYLDYAEIPDK